jgi:hypothetical protein
LPVPDIFLQSIFHPPENFAHRYQGEYLIFRHDKERDVPEKPFLQACASISENGRGLLVYKDEWSGQDVRQSYSGLVFSVGKVTNIVGESRTSGLAAAPEIWWCGLVGLADGDGRASLLRGYVSDITQKGTPFTDRIVMIRVDKKEHGRVKRDKEFYLTFDSLVKAAGNAMAAYLVGWQDIKIEDEPLEPK